MGDDGHKLVLGFLAHPSLPPQMDPVQKAVLSHTFGGPLLKTKRPIISCNVCQIRFNSQVRSLAARNGWGSSSLEISGEQRAEELGRGAEIKGISGRAGNGDTVGGAGADGRHLRGTSSGCNFNVKSASPLRLTLPSLGD